MNDKEKWDQWLEWHKDWKRRRNEEFREINRNRNYSPGGKQDAMKQAKEKYMNEFWETRKLILGR